MLHRENPANHKGKHEAGSPKQGEALISKILARKKIEFCKRTVWPSHPLSILHRSLAIVDYVTVDDSVVVVIRQAPGRTRHSKKISGEISNSIKKVI